MIGFEGYAPIVDLPRKEIVGLGLPVIWHGRFTADFVCHSEIAGDFVIPKGFISDAASVPRPLWWIQSDTDPDIEYASFAHDLLYSVHGKLPDRTLTRKDCDGVIREQMKAVGSSRFHYQGVYLALRAFGWHGWNSHTPEYKLVNTPYRAQLSFVVRP
jgi:hypothetical protein